MRSTFYQHFLQELVGSRGMVKDPTVLGSYVSRSLCSASPKSLPRSWSNFLSARKGFFTLLLKAQRLLKLGQKKSGPAPGACSSLHMDIPLAGATVSNPNTYGIATGANQQLFPSPPAEK